MAWSGRKQRRGMGWKAVMKREEEEEVEEDDHMQGVESTAPVHHAIRWTPKERAWNYNLDKRRRVAFLTAKPRGVLFRYQHEGVEFMRSLELAASSDLRGGWICDPPRSGKTRMIQTRVFQDIQERLQMGQLTSRFGQPTLYIVPTATLVDNVIAESLEHFDPETGLIVGSILTEDADANVHDILAHHDMVVVTYATITALHRRKEQDALTQVVFGTQWRRIVCDEAHRLANEDNTISAAVHRIRADYWWYVTANPIQNRWEDLVSALRFIGVRHVPSQGSKELDALLQRVMLRRTLERIAEENPKVMIVDLRNVKDSAVLIDFQTESERRLYGIKFQEMKQEVVVDADDNERPRALPRNKRENALLRLRQICVQPRLLPSDYVLPAGMRHASVELDGRNMLLWIEAKLLGTTAGGVAPPPQWPPPHILPPISTKELKILDELRAIEGTGQKMVLFSEWTKSLEHLYLWIKHRATLRGQEHSGTLLLHGDHKPEERARTLHLMRTDPKMFCLLITFQSGGVGEDFTFANIGGLYEPWWTPATEDQALLRLSGFKQTKETRIFRLMIRNTVESDYVFKLACKKRPLDEVLDANALDRQHAALDAEVANMFFFQR